MIGRYLGQSRSDIQAKRAPNTNPMLNTINISGDIARTISLVGKNEFTMRTTVCSTIFGPVRLLHVYPRADTSCPWEGKGVSTTSQSGRHTLLYPGGHISKIQLFADNSDTTVCLMGDVG